MTDKWACVKKPPRIDDMLDHVSIPWDFLITEFERVKGWGRSSLMVKAVDPVSEIRYIGLVYHATEVARVFINAAGDVARLRLSHGGWKGFSTRRRINTFLSHIGVNAQVFAEGTDRHGRGGTWTVGDEEWDGQVFCRPMRLIDGQWEVNA